ncbi:MAG: YncE family protein [Planctomycetota bacterium]|jgi:YVTN family beta-propeller protein
MQWFSSVLAVSLTLGTSLSSIAGTLAVVNKDEGSLSILDTESGTEHHRVQVGEGPHEVAISPDGTIAVVGMYQGDGTLKVVDLDSGQLRLSVSLQEHESPHGVVFLDDEHVLVTSESSELLLKINISSGEIVQALETSGNTHMIALNADRTVVYATNSQPGAIDRIDLITGARQTNTLAGEGAEAVGVSPDGKQVWTGRSQGPEHQSVSVFDATTLEHIDTFDMGFWPIRLAFTPDGEHALVTCFLSGQVAVLDTQSHKELERVTTGSASIEREEWEGKTFEEIGALFNERREQIGRPLGVLSDPSGEVVYVSNRGLKEIVVLDTGTWEIVKRIPAGEGPDGMAYTSRVLPSS